MPAIARPNNGTIVLVKLGIESWQYGLLTVREWFELSVLDIGGKEGIYMKKRKDNVYADEPLGDVRVIDDFLPTPDELVFKEDNVKVTLGLSKRSVEFFKKEAKKHHTQYQKMIRRLLDLYATHHQ